MEKTIKKCHFNYSFHIEEDEYHIYDVDYEYLYNATESDVDEFACEEGLEDYDVEEIAESDDFYEWLKEREKDNAEKDFRELNYDYD